MSRLGFSVRFPPMQADEVTQKLRNDVGFEIREMSPDSVIVETTGLEKFDRRNLQVAGIPKVLVPVAQRYMLEVAAYCVAVKVVGHGQTVGVPWEKGHNVVRAVESKSVFGKDGWLRRKRPTLRLIPPDPGCSPDSPPSLALATEILNHAHERARAGEHEEAAHAAAWSIDIYPGKPGIESRQPGYNMENYLAYEMLFSLTNKREYLEKALTRSIDFQIAMFGVPIQALTHLPEPEELQMLVEALRALAKDLHAKIPKVEEGEPRAPMALPIFTPNGDVLEGGICLVPTEYVQLYYEGPARKMVDDERTPLLVAESAHRGQRDPGRLALLAWMPRANWVEMQLKTLPIEGVPCLGPEFLLSALLCEVGRCGAAGCTWAETRAHFGLDSDETLEASAKLKLAAIAQQVEGWLTAFFARLGQGAV